MTQLSRLSIKVEREYVVKSSKEISPNDISIIIPVRNNQEGIGKYLDNLLLSCNAHTLPSEIIIVDNNSKPEIKIDQKILMSGLTVRLIKCTKPGPGAARNKGVKNANGKWILFNDSDCVPTSDLISGYIKAHNMSIGYAGDVKSLGSDAFSKYYESQEILIPPKIQNNEGEFVPQYLITANTLIWKEAFYAVGGFNESIRIAGGEDIDLGLRLSKIGNLSYALKSIVYHDFNDSYLDFVKRFYRYGKANKIIESIWGVHMKPAPFKSNLDLQINNVLSRIQYLSLLLGYISKTKEHNMNWSSEEIIKLITAIIGSGGISAIISRMYTKNKTKTEIEKTKAEIAEIKERTKKLQIENDGLKLAVEANQDDAATEYKQSDTGEVVLYDSRRHPDIGYDFEGICNSIYQEINGIDVAITSMGKGTVSYSKGVIKIERENTEGRFELWLKSYTINGEVREVMPKSDMTESKRKIKIKFEAKISGGSSHSLKFIFKGKQSKKWLGVAEKIISSDYWDNYIVYVFVKPYESCQLRIDDRDVTIAPSFLQIRNLVISEKQNNL